MPDLRLELQPKQIELARLVYSEGREAPTMIGYGGALGGGKSAAARRLMLHRRYKYPGTKGIILRRVFRDLYDNHIEPLFRDHPHLREHYRADAKELHLPDSGGSVLGFMHAETRSDVMRQFAGPEFFDVFTDQAEQFTEEELLQIDGRVRWPKFPPGTCKNVLFFNPGGPSMEFLRRIFWTKEYRGKERSSNYAFVQAYGWDNYQWFTHLMTEAKFYTLSNEERFTLFIEDTAYGRKLDALPQSLRAGYLLGSFESFIGQYFAGFWDDQKNVISASMAAEIIQPWWTRWMAQDWAFAEHAAHGWYAAGKLSPSQWMKYFGGHTDHPMDVVIKYREYVVAGRAESDLANDIVERTPVHERRDIQTFFLSADAFGQKAKQGKHSVGEMFTDVMRRHGLPSPEPAEQERKIGWRFMANCMRQAHLRGTNVSEERSLQGPAYFVSAECPATISHIPLAIRDDKDPDDVARVAGALWEDITDCDRYALKSQLSPRSKAPANVRAREIAEAIIDDEPTADKMTAVAMAMRQFKQGEGAIVRVGRTRGGRWRG